MKTAAKVFIVIGSLEIKLTEIKRLLENEIITQSEYEKMRESVISQFH